MFRGKIIAGAAVALMLGIGALPARAGDTMTLVLKSQSVFTTAATVPALETGLDGGAETLAVRGGYHRGYYGGYGRGYYGGYGRAYYGGYRGYYSSGYGRGYYGGYYRYPRASLYFDVGVYPSYYYQPYYVAPPAYCPPAPTYYYLPLSGASVPFAAALDVLPSGFSSAERLPAPRPTVVAPPSDGTYPYDGGPRNVVPMPPSDPIPSTAPSAAPARPATLPLEGRAVSVPVKPTKFAYPAYGEEPGNGSFAADRAIPVKQETAKKTSGK